MPKCKYCERETGERGKICGACRTKLPLVKQLIEMLAPYKKIVAERKARNEMQSYEQSL